MGLWISRIYSRSMGRYCIRPKWCLQTCLVRLYIYPRWVYGVYMHLL